MGCMAHKRATMLRCPGVLRLQIFGNRSQQAALEQSGPALAQADGGLGGGLGAGAGHHIRVVAAHEALPRRHLLLLQHLVQLPRLPCGHTTCHFVL
jgi:hypothetical protein